MSRHHQLLWLLAVGVIVGNGATAAPQKPESGQSEPGASESGPSLRPPQELPQRKAPSLPVPPHQLPELQPPELQLPTSQQRGQPSPVESRIREALQHGRADQTGDPVLDDLLQVIQQRGSVLDGSVLENSDQAAMTPATVGDFPDARPSRQQQQKLQTAEMLLRTARQLSRWDHEDRQRQQLVAQMRAEAIKLLTE